MSSPLADLSYRNYDGPMDSPTMRWWVIAKQVLRMSMKKKSLWWLIVLAGFYYLIFMAITFFMQQTAQAAQPMLGRAGQMPVDPLQQFFSRIIWKDQFLHGLSMAQLFFFSIALLVGIGAIANDNRANALLVYLSKPCEKLDYLLGKWLGVAMVLFMAMGIPTFFFYLYGILSYREHGFFSDNPLLFFKLVVTLVVNSLFQASITVGISSLFNQGRLAGATYAGIYFISSFFTVLMSAAYVTMNAAERASGFGSYVKYLFYASVDGLQIGMAKAMLGTDGSPPFGMAERSMRQVPAPPLWGIFLIIAAISALFLLLAWKRVRAVEIVG